MDFSLPLQDEFAHRVAALEKQKTTQKASLSKLGGLFVSLQHLAFIGSGFPAVIIEAESLPPTS